MQDSNLNNLDEVFRNHLDRPAAEGPSDSEWQQMRQLLINENLIRKEKRRRIFLLLLLVPAIAFSSWLLLHILYTRPVISGNSHVITEQPLQEEQHLTHNNAQVETGNGPGTKTTIANSSSPDLVTYPNTNTPTTKNKAVRHDAYANLNDRPPVPSILPNTVIAQAEKGTDPVSPGIQDASLVQIENGLDPERQGIQEAPGNAVSDTNVNVLPATSVVLKDTAPDSLKPASVQGLKKDDQRPVNKWGLGIYVAPENSRYRERGDTLNEINIPDSQFNVCGTWGLTLSYRLTNSIRLQSGILYSQKQKISFGGLIPDKFDSNGMVSSYARITMEYSGRYLEIPLSIKIYSGPGRSIQFYGLAGLIAGFNMPGSKSYFMRESFTNSELVREKIKLSPLSVGLSGQLAAGLEIQTGGKWSVYAEPFYKYSFSPVVQHSTYKKIPLEHLNRSWGAAFGVVYHFNKIRL